MNLLKLTLMLLALFLAPLAFADEIEREPIHYDTAPASNCVSRLEERLRASDGLLRQTEPRAFLRALLQELKVPESSQVLVFSRTSLQRQKISPERPRAIFFSDDVYVGCCQNSNLFELSAVDPSLGVVFYSAELRPGQRPELVRHNDACMRRKRAYRTASAPYALIVTAIPGFSCAPPRHARRVVTMSFLGSRATIVQVD